MEVVSRYTEHVPFEIGVKLKEYGYWNPGCTYESSYNGPCYFTSSKNLYRDGVVAPWDEIVPAPTYAEVFDWFFQEKGIVITLEPFFTNSLKENIAFTWKVSFLDCKNLDGPVIRNICEEDVWDSSQGYGGSFLLTAAAAIESAMKIQQNN